MDTYISNIYEMIYIVEIIMYLEICHHHIYIIATIIIHYLNFNGSVNGKFQFFFVKSLILKTNLFKSC